MKAKAKAKAATESEPVETAPTAEQLEAKRLWQQRREVSKWAQAQVEVIRDQLQAAQKLGNCDWLQISHEFHEIRLIRLGKRLEEKTIEGVPQETRDGLASYLSQCANGPDVNKDNFREEQGIWDFLEQAEDCFKRPEETPETVAVIEKIKVWEVSKESDASGLTAAMAENLRSYGVQEAGLTRIGGLLSLARENGGTAADVLTSHVLMPAVVAAMRGCMADARVQRAGCAALRGIAMASGQMPYLRDAGGIQLAVEALTAHYKDKEVALAANGAFWAMAQAAGKNSPELGTMQETGVIEILLKVMTHHAWDQTLCGRVRVTLPFLKDD